MKALRRILLIFLVLVGGLPPLSGWTQVDITVTRTVIQRIPVAVVGLAPFHLESGGADLAAQATDALRQYADEVRRGAFPSEDHTYDK